MSHASNREWNELMKIREHRLTLAEEIEGYLPEAELAQAMKKANLPAQVLALQSAELRRLRERGWIEDFRHMEMEQVLVDLLDLQGRTERIKNFPYPRQYATLNTSFVWIFLLLLPFGLVHEFDKLGTGLVDYPLVSRYFVWLSVPFSVIVMWVFHTMQRVGQVGENPFEGSANDVPITTISRGIEIDLREMIDDDPTEIPGPIEPRLGTQL